MKRSFPHPSHFLCKPLCRGVISLRVPSQWQTKECVYASHNSFLHMKNLEQKRHSLSVSSCWVKCYYGTECTACGNLLVGRREEAAM